MTEGTENRMPLGGDCERAREEDFLRTILRAGIVIFAILLVLSPAYGRDALALVEVRVLDHFIVTAEDSVSFAESGLL